MTIDEYRKQAEWLRDSAEKLIWMPRETRQMMIDIAEIYDTLAKATKALERQPLER